MTTDPNVVLACGALIIALLMLSAAVFLGPPRSPK